METVRVRALVLLESGHDRERLCERLHRLDVEVDGTGSRLHAACDLCFFDAAGLARHYLPILEFRRAASPACMPCVLVGNAEDNESALAQHHACIDHVLTLPVSDAALRIQIGIALRVSRDSRDFGRRLGEVNAKARLSEERYRIVSEMTSDYAYCIAVTPDGSFEMEWATSRFERLSGYSFEEMRREGWKRMIHPDDLPVIAERADRLLQGEVDVREVRLLTRSGELRHVIDHAAPVLDQGRIVRVYGAAQDITEQKATQAALRDSEHKAAEIARMVPVLVYQIDAQGHVHYVNDRWTQFTGLPLERAYGLGWQDAIHPDDLAQFTDWNGIFREGRTLHNEMRYLKPDGEVVWVYTSAEPHLGPDGSHRGYIGTALDITERKRAEEELRAHAEILANMAEGVVVTDAAGHIFFVNTATEQAYGYPARDLVGQHIGVLHATPPDESRWLIAGAMAVLKEKGFWSGEFEARRANGDVFTCATRVSRLEIGGKPYLISVQQDVTERKRAEETKLRLAAIVQSSDDAIIGIGLDGTIMSWNPGAEKMYGYCSGEIRGRPISILDPDGCTIDYPRIAENLARGVGLKNLETRRRRKDGAVIDVSVTLSPLKDATGRIFGGAKISRDITERKRAEENLRLWGRAIEATSNGIMMVDHMANDQPVIYANPAFMQITGYAMEEVLGRNARFLQGGDTGQEGLQEIRTAIREQREGHAVLINYRKDGSRFWNELSVAPVRDADGRVRHFIGVINDITERKRYEDELAFQANHDTLTRLPNRALLHDRLQQAIAHAHRHERLLVVLFIDLDNFKVVNDSVGHEAGDAVLCQAAERLRGAVRKGDTVARLGGDEFVIVAQHVENEPDATQFAQRVLNVISQPIPIGQQEFFATCSIGISIYPRDGDSPSDLLKHADAAMYTAKESGRNAFRFYAAEMNARAQLRIELEAALRRAIVRNEFVVHYQPQMDLASGGLVGFEALVRWQHPKHGLMAPNTFIGLAEETGLIVQIGNWVLREACRQAKFWQAQGLGDFFVAVNLSARQFKDGNLTQLVDTALQDMGLDARFLELEITESLLMENPEAAADTLRRLRARGVRLSIDDFGTGYSSLGYLKRFPLDKLKIDSSFVRDITSEPDDAAIATAIIAMAHRLKLKVVAEGVETEGQLDYLRQHCCDAVQGYYFSRPLTARDCLKMLKSRPSYQPPLLTGA